MWSAQIVLQPGRRPSADVIFAASADKLDGGYALRSAAAGRVGRVARNRLLCWVAAPNPDSRGDLLTGNLTQALADSRVQRATSLWIPLMGTVAEDGCLLPSLTATLDALESAKWDQRQGARITIAPPPDVSPGQLAELDRRLVARTGDAPADIGDVLLDELAAVRLRRIQLTGPRAGAAPPADPLPPTDWKRPAQDKLNDYYRQVHEFGDLSALCLSGGGVRSAAFALGIIQGLAARGILPRFDYLSTVSGGGYIGGCLTAWVHRHGYEKVNRELAGAVWPSPSFSPLQHLRRYSNFLAPRKGLLTADTLTLVALYVRNLVLNWLVLVPLLVLVIVGVKLIAAGAWTLRGSAWMPALAIPAVILIGWAVADSLRQRPGWESAPSNPIKFQWQEVVPTVLGGLLLSAAVLVAAPQPAAVVVTADMADPVAVGATADAGAVRSSPDSGTVLARVGLMGSAVALIGWMIAFYFSKPRLDRAPSTQQTVRTAKARYVVLSACSFAASGLVSGSVVAIAAYLAYAVPHPDVRALLVISVGPPMLTSALFLGELFYIGATSYVPWAEGEREWLARAAGHHGRAAAIWTMAFAFVLFGSLAVHAFAKSKLGLPWLVSAGGAIGALIAVLGKAPATVATVKRGYESLKHVSADVILAILTPVFVVIVVSLLSYAVDFLVNAGEPLRPSSLDPSIWIWLPGIAGAMVVIGTLASIGINTNRFSLHGMYRNRLIRAFLGASNDKRQSNKFTDFDENDNFRLSDLWPNKPCAAGVPPQLLICNMALNVVATKELAWQERKALSFTAAARWIGCGSLLETGCYRPADRYGSGMSLGTAMTISGAAASPNMGYHSSPALSVLLTFFNVRLGAWLGNPGPSGAPSHTLQGRFFALKRLVQEALGLTAAPYTLQGPFFAIKPLVQEALGLTTDDKQYVYLSDGGHFENLGLYEMVRRRCHLIVVSDSGCDPTTGFEDLGNALRKISIDQNIVINFRALRISGRQQPPVEGPYCALADIIYPEPHARSGLLLYIKPGFHGLEPPSVRSYAAANAAFPHEPTSDQWFGETQFEAYRALGEFVLKSLDGDRRHSYPGIKEFLEAVVDEQQRRAVPPSERAAPHLHSKNREC